MFRTIFTTLGALLKSGLCATQLCIRSDTASYATGEECADDETFNNDNVKFKFLQGVPKKSTINNNNNNDLYIIGAVCHEK